jgi:signal transduction histidine kinase
MKEKKNLKANVDLYKRRSTANIIILSLAFAIALASVYFTRVIVEELKEREQRFIELYARTLEFTASESSSTSEFLFLMQEIMIPNNSIPVILTDGAQRPIESRNVPMDPLLSEMEKEAFLRQAIVEMRDEHEPIQINFRDPVSGEIIDYQYVYYQNSALLNQLEYYPLVQLAVIGIFGIIVYIVFSYSKASEQNRVWVGLAKETAHQLGTPISSLMAWVEYFKEDEALKNNEIIGELEKDIQRLEMITSRFSNIGSVPVLYHENIPATIENTVAYLKKRLSKKVDFTIEALPRDIRAKINKPLFEWVIENLCKNAVDSMGGIGRIHISIKKGQDSAVIIDVTDTGKGIPKSKVKNVFSPGYTTKSRGWGLGLTLVKRIIEKYHQGKIFVHNTELDQGTTFRILLNG